MTGCGVIEWGAIAVALGLSLSACGMFFWVVRKQGVRITQAHEAIGLVATRMTKVETEQETCQKNLSARLLKGDRSFETISTQVQTLQTAAEGLTKTAQHLQGMVNKMEQRMWDGHDRRDVSLKRSD